MLFDTQSTLAANASLNALWMKTQVITNNLANVDTPGFKASSLSFQQVLANTKGRGQKNIEGQDVSAQNGRSSGYVARISTDENSSIRIDGNNVSLEREESELWKTYAQYSYLLDRLKGHYGSINTAISNMRT